MAIPLVEEEPVSGSSHWDGDEQSMLEALEAAPFAQD